MTSPSYSDAIKTKNTDFLLAYNVNLMAIGINGFSLHVPVCVVVQISNVF